MKLTTNFDILIIGGGAIGLSLARELRRKGVERIGILERNSACGNEASSAAAGMLAPQSEADCADDFFKFCSESRDSYPQFARELFDETGVDVELDKSGTLYLAFTEKDAAELEKRFAWQRAATLPVEKLTAREVLEIEPHVSPDVSSGLFFPNDWQVENRQLMAALRKYAQANGVEILTETSVENLLLENDKIIGAETANEKFHAEKIVLATGAWTSLVKIENRNSALKVKPVRGQMMSFRSSEKLFSKVIYTARGYLVPRRDNRILAGATVENVGFDKSLTTAGEEFLHRNSFEIAPVLKNLKVTEKWAGLRPKSADNLPILGAFPQIENLYAATAHYRNGILLAPGTAKIMADEIVGNGHSEYPEIFSPQRFLAETGKTVTNSQSSGS